MTVEDNKRLVALAVGEIINGGNLDAVDRFYAPEIAEAARAWVEHGFDELALDRIVAVTHPENVASQRVLEKVGMRYERMTDYDGVTVRLYAIERES